MKSRFNKIVIPTLAICLGAALAGSISGTVAWYQYSTRASTAYLGTSAGTSGNLKLRIQGTEDWKTQLTDNDIQNYFKDEEGKSKLNLAPITSGDMLADAALNKIGGDGEDKDLPKFYKNPIRSMSEKDADYSKGWLVADKNMYFQLPLELCYIEYDGVKEGEGENAKDEKFIDKDVYLSDLLIQQDYQNANIEKHDLSNAIRVHFSSTYEEKENEQMVEKNTNKLVSKNGGSILTSGHLDLDGDGQLDKVNVGSDSGAKYGFGPNVTSELVTYGSGKQTSFSNGTNVVEIDENHPERILPAVVESENDGVTLKEENLTYDVTENEQTTKVSKKIGRTYASAAQGQTQKYLEVVVTIWVEGWQGLEPVADDPATDADESNPGTVWDATDFIGSMFDVGMQFAVQAE